MTLIIIALLAPFTFLTACFATELLAGLRPLPRLLKIGGTSATFRLIVPAHNEAKGIRASLERLVKEVGNPRTVLVVADNCSDNTAAIASEFGVEVIERNNPKLRGKGFALDFARDHLRRNAPDLVIILDADCMITAESILQLTYACAETGRPCQAANLLVSGLGAAAAVQISTFAFFVKNIIRQRALQRITGGVHVLGTGIALPWSLFERVRLATSNIVEDLQLGLDLSQLGYKPLLVESALVTSPAEDKADTLTQRQRWEGGYLQTAGMFAPAQFRFAVAQRSARELWAAIDLMIPPFTLLLAADAFVMVLAVLWLVFTGTGAASFAWLLGSMLAVVVSLCLIWVREGRTYVSARTLAAVPFYMLWKIPMYWRLLRSGSPTEWLRTRGR